MSLWVAWIVAPALLLAILWALGLLVEAVAGLRLPGTLVPACGLAMLVIVAATAVTWRPTASLAVPLVAALAVAGGVLGRPWADPRLRRGWRWPALTIFGAFLVFAVPSLLTGQGSVTGYVRLDDSASWMGLTDWVLTHGRDTSGLLPSTYQRMVQSYLDGGYPVGGFLPMGIAARLTGQDLANVYQPTIAVLAAVFALGLSGCARALLSRPAAALAALVAVQASLFVGYTQWGGIKEAAAAALLPLLAACAVRAGAPRDGLRALAVACVGAGGILAILGIDGIVWAGPAVAGAAAAAVWSTRPSVRRGAGLTLGFGVLLAALSIPVLATLNFLAQSTSAHGGASSQSDLGNLIAPLPLLQGAGLWPVGDLRVRPDPHWLAVALALGGLALAVIGVAISVRRARLEPAALVGLTGVGVVPAVVIGSPWVDAKALALLAPVLLLAAAIAVGRGLLVRRTQAVAAFGATALILGCAWSTLAIVRDVAVAPRERLAELRELAQRIAGDGPTLVLDFDAYADRYFLRDADPDGATDLRARPVPGRDGSEFPRLTTAEIDEVAPSALAVYRTIVRRRSPVSSRPPAAYRRVWAGPSYEAWQRAPGPPPTIAHLSLGNPLEPVDVPRCADVRALAQTAGARSLAAVPRSVPIVLDARAGTIPARWATPAGVRPVVDGTEALTVRVHEAGRWRVWVGGSTLGRLAVAVDGRTVGVKRHELAHDGQWLRYGVIGLRAGVHRLSMTYQRGGLPAGAGPPGNAPRLGPIALTPASDDRAQPVITVARADYRRLCSGRTYDWIEARF